MDMNASVCGREKNLTDNAIIIQLVQSIVWARGKWMEEVAKRNPILRSPVLHVRVGWKIPLGYWLLKVRVNTAYSLVFDNYV